MSDYLRANELHPEIVSVHALNPDVAHDAPARSTMFSSHFAQRPVILGSEPNLTQSIHSEWGKYTFGVRMPEEGSILFVLHRFPRSVAGDSIDTRGVQTESFVFYRSHETGEIGYFVLPYYKSYHPYFGYKLKYTPAVDRIHKGAVFEKDTVFADTPANVGEHNYTHGVNLNMAVMSHPNVGLDGYVIRRGALEKFRFNVYEKRSMTFGLRSFLLNLYGDEENYKPLPEIGEYTREDGLLATVRDFNAMMSASTLSVKDTMQINHLFDRRIYSRPGRGKVIDIKVTKTGNVNKDLPPQMSRMLERYANAEYRFYNEIVKFEESLIQESRRSGNDGAINITRDLQKLFVKAKGEINYPITVYKDGRPVGRRTAPLQVLKKNDDLDAWHVEVTIEYEVSPSRGFKFSCCHGGGLN